MKKILITFIWVLVFGLAKAQYGKIISTLQFPNLENREKPGYGSQKDPLESGAFMSLDNGKRVGMKKLFNSYRWPNGDKINFSSRFSTAGGSKGIIDCYTLINTETKDTVKLYVDPYKTSEKYYVPKGLVALSPAVLKPEIEPVLTLIEEINNAEDGSTLKLHAGDIMRYLSANFDQDLLIDEDRLKFLIEDKEADKSLIGFLMRSYIFNKFYALARDIANEGDYAFEKSKASYKSYMKAHPETTKGKIEEHLK